MNPEPMLLDYRDAARALAVCERTLRELASTGEIAVVRVGSRGVRFARAELERWIESRSETRACKTAG